MTRRMITVVLIVGEVWSLGDQGRPRSILIERPGRIIVPVVAAVRLALVGKLIRGLGGLRPGPSAREVGRPVVSDDVTVGLIPGRPLRRPLLRLIKRVVGLVRRARNGFLPRFLVAIGPVGFRRVPERFDRTLSNLFKTSITRRAMFDTQICRK